MSTSPQQKPKTYLLEFHAARIKLKDLDTDECRTYTTVEGLIQSLKQQLGQGALNNRG
jgi:hypothetical protein